MESCLWSSTTTAADGTYTFGTVGSGDYDLEFTATAYNTEWFDNAASAAAGSVTVESGQATTADAALLLSLLPPGSISGTVTTDDVSAVPISGVPIEGATVTLYEDGGIVSVEQHDNGRRRDVYIRHRRLRRLRPRVHGHRL